MTDKQEALYRTFKPLFAGTIAALTIYGLIQLFTPMQLALGTAFFVAVYLLILVYEMNLHTVQRERKNNPTVDQE